LTAADDAEATYQQLPDREEASALAESVADMDAPPARDGTVENGQPEEQAGQHPGRARRNTRRAQTPETPETVASEAGSEPATEAKRSGWWRRGFL
jgi:hypothetical protein